MALYTLKSLDEVNSFGSAPIPGQTRLYNMLGRQNGANSEDENFFAKRGKSIENALGTTGAWVVGNVNDAIENANIDRRNEKFAQNMDDIYKNAGFNNADDYYAAKDEAEKNAFSKIGFDIDDYWNKRAELSLNDPNGTSSEIAALDSQYEAAKSKLAPEDADNIARFSEIQDKLINQSAANMDEQKKAQKSYEDYRKNDYISQKVNQDRGKFAGSAINTLSTMFDIMAPGAGIAANSVQGGIEGIADELEQNGLKNFDWNRAGQNALIGATTGAVTGGLNKGVNNMLAKNGGNLFKGGNAITGALNNLGSQTATGRIASTLATGAGRGALSGAVGGATGAGLSAAINGQDVLGSALEGARRGAGQGAMAGGVMAGAGLAKNSLKNAINGGQTPETEVYNRLMQQNEPEDQNAIANRQNAQLAEEDSDLYPAFEPGSDRIQQRNKLQAIGDQLQTAAKTQKYSALYDSLDNKTAARAVQTGAPDKLESLGVRPENYLEAAKTSDYINKLMTNLADNSEVKVMVPDMTDRLSLDNMDILMPDNAVKKYNDYVRQIVADGSTPDEYSAGYLLKKSRELSKAAANLRGNTEGVAPLRQALNEAKYTLRDLAAESLANADITSNIANDQVAKGLAKLGANKQIQDYYTETVDGKAPNVRDYIARSALFEQARDMGSQIESEKYTRSASKAPSNPLTRLWVASGLEQPVNTVLKNTVAPVASGITKVAGKALEGAGNIEANIKNAISGVNTPIATNNTSVDTSNVIDTNYNPATKVYEAIGRTEGLTNAEQAKTANYITNAVQQQNNQTPIATGNTLESLVAPNATTGGTSVYDSMYGANNTPTRGNRITGNSGNTYFQATGDYWTDILAKAMTSAIDDNDVKSFASLYGMYQDALSKLEKNTESSTKKDKITATQQRANAAMNSLNRISNMTPDLGYNLSAIPLIGNIATLGGNDYESEAKSLAQQIGYMVSGANIKEEEAYNIGKAYVPQPFDSEQTRKSKLNRAYDIIRQYQNGYAEEA